MGLIIASNFLIPVNIVYHKDPIKKMEFWIKYFSESFGFQYDLSGLPGITY